MSHKFYITVIVLLTGLSVFLALAHRRDCRMLDKADSQCMMPGKGMQGRGMGMGMGNNGCGAGMSEEAQAARDSLFGLIKAGSNDTALIFSRLEGVLGAQRQNQKAAILRILSMRDSLTGDAREAFLRQIDDRFCRKQGRQGMRRGMGKTG